MNEQFFHRAISRPWVAGLGVLVMFLTACGQSPHVNESSAHLWHPDTLQLVTNSENDDGGFSLLSDQRPSSLYDTFYNLEILAAMGHKIPMTQALTDTLLSLQQHAIAPIKSSGALLNLYYTVGIEKQMGVSIATDFRSRVAHVLQKLPRYDNLISVGVQSNNEPLMTELLETQTVVDIAHDLSLPVAEAPDESTIMKQLAQPPYRTSPYILSAYASLAAIESVVHPGANRPLKNIVVAYRLRNKFLHPATGLPSILNSMSAAQLMRQESVAFHISNGFKRSLSHLGVRTGGYTIFAKNVMDPNVTYEFHQLFHVQNGSARLAQSILKTQLPSGLFGWNNAIPSDPMDSYWAVRVFQGLGSNPPRSLRNYFYHTSLPKTSSLSVVWSFDKARTLLGLRVPSLTLPRAKGLTNALTSVRILALTPASRNVALHILKKDIGILGHPRKELLENMFLAVSAAQSLRYPLPAATKEKLASYVARLQKPDGGFAPPNQDAGDLTDTYYCVAILSALHTRPRNMEALRSFLQAQKNHYGGYAGGGVGTATTLQATYEGIRIQRLLKTSVHGGGR